MNKIVVIDELKKVKQSNLEIILSYCGKIQSIEKQEKETYNYFIVEYSNENELATSLFLDNTIVDEVQIKIKKLEEFEKQNNTNQINLNENDDIDLNETPRNENTERIEIENEMFKDYEKPVEISKKEKIKQKGKEFGEKVETQFTKIESFVVEKYYEGKKEIQKRRGKEEFVQYDLPENYNSANHSENFNKQKFVVQQKQTNISNENNLNSSNTITKKPLPPIPQQK